MNDRERVKAFTEKLLEVWGINLAPFMLKPIFDKIEHLPDDKIEESIKLVKEFF